MRHAQRCSKYLQYWSSFSAASGAQHPTSALSFLLLFVVFQIPVNVQCTMPRSCDSKGISNVCERCIRWCFKGTSQYIEYFLIVSKVIQCCRYIEDMLKSYSRHIKSYTRGI